MTTSDDLEQRVQVLENLAARYTTLRTDEQRLSAGVERLADETGGLNAILTKVDDQQQRLSTLGRDLARVEKTKVSKNDLEDAKSALSADSLDFKKRTLARIRTIGILLTLALLCVGAGLWWYQAEQRQDRIDLCKGRTAQNEIIVDILRGSIQDLPPERENAPGVQNVREGIARFEQLIISCEDL